MKTEFENSQCYGPQEWQTYCTGMLQEPERLKMEEHLLQCDNCMSTYLDVLQNGFQQQSVFQVGQDFTDKVMASIQKESYRQKHDNKINLIISYCAAACIVMFFWIGGYFDKISAGLSEGVKTSNVSKTIEVRVEPPKHFIQTGWTQNVFHKEKPSLEKSFLEKSFLDKSFLENLIPKKE